MQSDSGQTERARFRFTALTALIIHLIVSYENDQFYLFQSGLHLNKDLVIRYGYSDPITMPCVSYDTGVDLAVRVGMDLLRTLPMVYDLNDLYQELERFISAATLRLERLPKDFASSVFADVQMLCTKNVTNGIGNDVHKHPMMQHLTKWYKSLSECEFVEILKKDESHVVLHTVFAFWTAFMQNAVRQQAQQCEAYQMFGIHRCYIGERGLLRRIDLIWSEMRNNLADDLRLMHRVSSPMQHHCTNMVKMYNEVEEKIIDWSIAGIVSWWTSTRTGSIGVFLFEREPSTNLLDVLQRMGVVHLKSTLL